MDPAHEQDTGNVTPDHVNGSLGNASPLPDQPFDGSESGSPRLTENLGNNTAATSEISATLPLSNYTYLQAFHHAPAADREFVQDGFFDEHAPAAATTHDLATSDGAEVRTPESPNTPTDGRQRITIQLANLRSTRERLNRMLNILEAPPASAHDYLGSNMQDLPAAPVFSSNSTLEIPLIICPGVILFPGDTLPLRLRNVFQVSYLATQIDQSNTLLVAILSENTRKGAVGTCAELRSRHMQHGELLLKAKGASRFRLESVSPVDLAPGVYRASVTLLQDVEQPWKRGKRTRYDVTHPFPAWLYEAYHAQTLAEKVAAMLPSVTGWDAESALGRFKDEDAKAKLLADPLRLSYWLSSNLPLEDDDRQELLEFDDTSLRLRRCIEHLTEIGQMYLCCATCGSPLSRKSCIFTVPGADGVVGAYVNPHGIVHQTVTVRELCEENVLLYEGPASIQDTWFPGYSWTIAYCAECQQHLGWKFTSTLGRDLRVFWGLSRRELADRDVKEVERELEERAQQTQLRIPEGLPQLPMPFLRLLLGRRAQQVAARAEQPSEEEGEDDI